MKTTKHFSEIKTLDKLREKSYAWLKKLNVDKIVLLPDHRHYGILLQITECPSNKVHFCVLKSFYCFRKQQNI